MSPLRARCQSSLPNRGGHRRGQFDFALKTEIWASPWREIHQSRWFHWTHWAQLLWVNLHSVPLAQLQRQKFSPTMWPTNFKILEMFTLTTEWFFFILCLILSYYLSTSFKSKLSTKGNSEALLMNLLSHLTNAQCVGYSILNPCKRFTEQVVASCQGLKAAKNVEQLAQCISKQVPNKSFLAI